MNVKENSYYRTKIPNWPEGERPREKLMQLGPERLSESELIAILIRTGTPEITAVDLAKTLLRHHDGLNEMAGMDYQQFEDLKGMGKVKAVTLAAAFELARRMASQPIRQRLKITDPEVIFRHYEPQFAHLQKEIFQILILNSANCLVKDERISEGILNSSLVHPREVFKSAILASAASIILMHNHPSGEVKPSREDRNITRRLVEAGDLLNIPVLDHIIIGTGAYFSFRQAGLILE